MLPPAGRGAFFLPKFFSPVFFRCIDKIETVEEIEYDEVEQCDHSYDKKCHTTYVTEYESQQEEECKDNFKKSCDITYSPSAQNVTVELCMRPLVKVRCLTI